MEPFVIILLPWQPPQPIRKQLAQIQKVYKISKNDFMAVWNMYSKLSV